MDRIVVSCPLPRKCIMTNVDVRDKVEVLDPLICQLCAI